LAKDTSPTNPLARIFKSDPHRELFHTLADSLDQALLVISGSEARVLTCNHAFLLLSGYARRDLDDLTPADIFVNEPGRQALQRLEKCWEDPEISLQAVPLRTQAGRVIQVDLKARPVPPPRTAIMVFLQSTEERQASEGRELLAPRRLYTLAEMARSILAEGGASLPALIGFSKEFLRASHVALYRLGAMAPDFLIEGAMPSEFPEKLPAASLTGLARLTQWSLGQRPAHELQRAARAAELEALQTALVGDEKAWIGVLVAAWDNHEALPEEAPSLLEILATLFHLALHMGSLRSAFAESEQAREAIEEELAAHIEAITDTLLTVDERLVVQRSNASISRLLGYQANEIIGLPIQDVLVGPEDVTASLLDALGHRREAERSRLILHHRDGTPLPVHLRALPIQTNLGTHLLVILRDQSEQQAIEDQTEILAQRALLGEVTAIFAHEVRNPINNISTGVQLIASRLGQDHPQHEALERIRSECARLDQLMSDVLFFARPLELKMEELDLAELMDRILGRWMPRFHQSGVRCHTTYDPDTPKASADPRTLERVIVNLISNALEAMSEGGTLSVALAPARDTLDPMIELKVADTGPGIPPDTIERIFDPFFTTKKDGTGLGLAISRRILTAHKGNIHVESFPDAGTVFTIQLPAAAI